MKHPVWERLSDDLRARVDDLIAQDRKIPAIAVIREELGEPVPGWNLTGFRRGTDMRIFNGQVPPWPEAQEAPMVGHAVVSDYSAERAARTAS